MSTITQALVHEGFSNVIDRIFRNADSHLASIHGYAYSATSRCSCPSSDGSLGWPCRTHPPEAHVLQNGPTYVNAIKVIGEVSFALDDGDDTGIVVSRNAVRQIAPSTLSEALSMVKERFINDMWAKSVSESEDDLCSHSIHTIQLLDNVDRVIAIADIFSSLSGFELRWIDPTQCNASAIETLQKEAQRISAEGMRSDTFSDVRHADTMLKRAAAMQSIATHRPNLATARI